MSRLLEEFCREHWRGGMKHRMKNTRKIRDAIHAGRVRLDLHMWKAGMAVEDYLGRTCSPLDASLQDLVGIEVVNQRWQK